MGASPQIVHRTLAAMLGSLAALAALAIIGDVRLLFCYKNNIQNYVYSSPHRPYKIS